MLCSDVIVCACVHKTHETNTEIAFLFDFTRCLLFEMAFRKYVSYFFYLIQNAFSEAEQMNCSQQMKANTNGRQRKVVKLCWWQISVNYYSIFIAATFIKAIQCAAREVHSWAFTKCIRIRFNSQWPYCVYNSLQSHSMHCHAVHKLPSFNNKKHQMQMRMQVKPIVCRSFFFFCT